MYSVVWYGMVWYDMICDGASAIVPGMHRKDKVCMAPINHHR
jgi:hypothetical protein